MPGTDYVRYIERTLKALYEDGIIAGNDLKRMEEDSIIAIRLVDKNVATSRFIDQLYTVKEAYEYLLNADTAHYKKKILQQCNLNDYITPNLVYDEEKSEAAQKDLLSNISWANGFVLNGQKIIDRGEIVDEQTYNILESLRKEWEKTQRLGTREKTDIGRTNIICRNLPVLLHGLSGVVPGRLL